MAPEGAAAAIAAVRGRRIVHAVDPRAHLAPGEDMVRDRPYHLSCNGHDPMPELSEGHRLRGTLLHALRREHRAVRALRRVQPAAAGVDHYCMRAVPSSPAPPGPAPRPRRAPSSTASGSAGRMSSYATSIPRRRARSSATASSALRAWSGWWWSTASSIESCPPGSRPPSRSFSASPTSSRAAIDRVLPRRPPTHPHPVYRRDTPLTRWTHAPDPGAHATPSSSASNAMAWGRPRKHRRHARGVQARTTSIRRFGPR